MSALEPETLASVRHMVFASTAVIRAAASIIESNDDQHPAVGHLATAIAAAELARRELLRPALAPVIPLPDRCTFCRKPVDDCACFRPHQVGPTLATIRATLEVMEQAWWVNGQNFPLSSTCAALEVLACESMLEAEGRAPA